MREEDGILTSYRVYPPKPHHLFCKGKSPAAIARSMECMFTFHLVPLANPSIVPILDRDQGYLGILNFVTLKEVYLDCQSEPAEW